MIVLAVTAVAVFARADPEPPPLLPGDVTFLLVPNAEARFLYFPGEARQKRVEGRATVVCRVQADGRLADCRSKAEEPANYGFGEATVRLAQAEIRLGRKDRHGAETEGRLFQFSRIYALRGSAATKQVMPLDHGVAGEDGLRRRWIRAPDAAATTKCFGRAVGTAEDVELTLACKTSENDRLANCRVIKNTRAPDVRYEAAGICAIDTARFRAEDSAGKPVMGVEISVPLGFRKQAFKGPGPAPL